MKAKRIFLSFSSRSDSDRMLAYRLHTLASFYKIDVLLPDYHSPDKEYNTKERIESSDYVVSFVTKRYDKALREQIEVAKKSGIDYVLIYDKDSENNASIGKLINEASYKIPIGEGINIESALKNVLDKISSGQSKKIEKRGDGILALEGFMLVALGMRKMATPFEKGK